MSHSRKPRTIERFTPDSSISFDAVFYEGTHVITKVQRFTLVRAALHQNSRDPAHAAHALQVLKPGPGLLRPLSRVMVRVHFWGMWQLRVILTCSAGPCTSTSWQVLPTPCLASFFVEWGWLTTLYILEPQMPTSMGTQPSDEASRRMGCAVALHCWQQELQWNNTFREAVEASAARLSNEPPTWVRMCHHR